MNLGSNNQNDQFYKSDLDPITLVLKLDLDMVKMYHHTKNKVSMSRHSKVIACTDTQTHRQTHTHIHIHTQTHRQNKTLPFRIRRVVISNSCSFTVYLHVLLQLDVVNSSTSGGVDNFILSGEWDLVGFPVRRNRTIYSSGIPYPDVKFYTIMNR